MSTVAGKLVVVQHFYRQKGVELPMQQHLFSSSR